MEVAIKNIAFLAAIGNLVVNQLMESEAAVAITTKVTFGEEPKWTMVMAKNVRQVVSKVVETLADAPKQEEHKFNLRLMGFDTKEGETEKELVQHVNIKLLQGKMKLCAKVITATQLRFATVQASVPTTSMHLNMVLFKFMMSEDY
jgi:hypothetical protein